MKILPCPFCGAEPITGTANNPDSYWDGMLRGEKYGYVMCDYCNVILKDYTKKGAIKAWNKRGDWRVKEWEKQREERKKKQKEWEKNHPPKPIPETVSTETLQECLDRLDALKGAK